MLTLEEHVSMATLEDRMQQLQEEFSAAKIPTDSPGFYEDRRFIRREQMDPEYLENYARFVQWQPYSIGYLEKVELAVHCIAEELQIAMKEDGSPAAYNEAVLVMSRILEREGIWNYVARGSLVVTFPPTSGFDPCPFWPITKPEDAENHFGYKWIVAPPFRVIDIMLQLLDYPYPVTHLLPKIVVEKNAKPASVDADEILTPEVIEEFGESGASPEEGLDRILPNYRGRFEPDFTACVVERGGALLKYAPIGIVTSDATLEQFTGFVCKGRTAGQLYAQNIRSRLTSPRNN